MEINLIDGGMPTWEMSDKEKSLLNLQVDRLNKETFGSRLPKQELGKNDFLELLIAQLTHQDPTSPVEDTEFIAQMAQFTSLEQMMNVSESFVKLNNMLGASEAVNAVGKHVHIEVGGESVSGFISAARRGETPEVLVNGNWYDWGSVKTVYADNAN